MSATMIWGECIEVLRSSAFPFPSTSTSYSRGNDENTYSDFGAFDFLKPIHTRHPAPTSECDL